MQKDGEEHLLVFARYPQPGATKTRLMPAMGPGRAAALAQWLTQRTLDLARSFARQRGCRLTVYFSGGDARAMQAKFGSDVLYEEQIGHDLGERLTQATYQSWDNGAQRIVIIGSDCWELSDAHLHDAFDGLKTCDTVIGPAVDGGYYLIGLNRSEGLGTADLGHDFGNCLPIFSGIDWGSSQVLAQTQRALKRWGKTVVELSPLADIDLPEDTLTLRHEFAVGAVEPPEGGWYTSQPGRLSVIVATVNEAQHLPATLRSIGQPHQHLEVIVVDGGSSDETVAIASEFGAQVLMAERGRARQMNAGAAIATGQSLLFLHADTRLPEGYTERVEDCLSGGAVAGAFRLHIDGAGVALRMVAIGANVRSRLWQLPYGDQAIFMRAATFYQLSGYRSLAIMEDYELIRRLRRIGKVRLANASVSTSARRWHRKGVWTTTLRNQQCLVAYHCGLSSERIARLYRR